MGQMPLEGLTVVDGLLEGFRDGFCVGLLDGIFVGVLVGLGNEGTAVG